MKRKKLIFFVTTSAASNAAPLSSAYHLAAAGAGAGLEAEVRLAGDAVLVADPAYMATVKGGATLRQRIDAAAKAGIQVSVCPRGGHPRNP